MENLGSPMLMQNTTQGWQVTWTDAVTVGTEREIREAVSFTVVIPRKADLTMAEIQRYAVLRALELLQPLAKSTGK